jgi:hypothetical protein
MGPIGEGPSPYPKTKNPYRAQRSIHVSYQSPVCSFDWGWLAAPAFLGRADAERGDAERESCAELAPASTTCKRPIPRTSRECGRALVLAENIKVAGGRINATLHSSICA